MSDGFGTENIPNFFLVSLGPVLSFILGAFLIFLTDTPYFIGDQFFIASILWGSLAGVLTFGMVVIITRLPVSRSLREISRQLIPIFRDFSGWQLLLLALAAGIGEELFFRGFLQQWLTSWLSVGSAIVVAGLGFGVLHFANVSYFLLTATLGILFGIIYHHTQSLLLVMSWHGFYDLLVMLTFRYHPEWLGITYVD